MDGAGADAAMALSRRRDYGDSDLGHYGIGLKAASLSQADTLDVYTRAIGGLPVGRRITRDEPTRVQTLDPAQVGRVLDSPLVRTGAAAPVSGTVIRWSGFRNALVSPDRDERRSWISNLIEDVRSYLGLVLHRIIERGEVEISIDEYDTESARTGSARGVPALDPFPQTTSAARSYRFVGEAGGRPFEMRAVILTGGAHDTPGVSASRRLSTAEDGQGLYIYRNDRLLQIGGWNSVLSGGRDYANLRIAMSIDDRLLDVARINPEKSGVVLEHEMRRAIHDSVCEEIGTFRALLDSASSEAAASRKRESRPVKLVEPVAGISRDIYDAIVDSVELADADPIRIRWERMDADRLIEVDVDGRLLKINERHRLLFSTSTDPSDAPLLKTLVHLLYSRFFEGAYLGARQKRELEAYDRIITAALAEELRQRGMKEE